MTEPAKTLRLMLIMAHPDDAEFSAGGLMSLWHRSGHDIKILCLTNGNAGHHSLGRVELAQRRYDEASRAAAVVGAELEIWPEDDGRLAPDVALREKLIGAIREYRPDLIVAHRTADYHPDHRAAGQLVKDSIFLLQVPAIKPEQPPLAQMPSILLAWDRFSDPRPCRFDWVIDTQSVQEQVVDLLSCHASQVFEWLPALIPNAQGPFDRAWLTKFYQRKPSAVAKKTTSPDRPLTFAEAYEISDYGGYFDSQRFDFVAR